jgi:hypothetical protein
MADDHSILGVNSVTRRCDRTRNNFAMRTVQVNAAALKVGELFSSMDCNNVLLIDNGDDKVGLEDVDWMSDKMRKLRRVLAKRWGMAVPSQEGFEQFIIASNRTFSFALLMNEME